MGTHTVKMPDLGEGITEVEIVAWHVKAGDSVAEDQVLADVMTDKATVEIPSPVAGTVRTLGGDVGQVLAVGSALIEIAVDEDTAGSDAASSPSANRSAANASASAAASVAAVVPAAAASPDTSAKPASSRAAGAAPAPTSATSSTSPEPPEAQPPGRNPPARSQTQAAPGGARPIASPALRRRAWELGIDLNRVQPSGAGGRVLQADLDAHTAAHGATLGAAAHGGASRAPAAPARTGLDEQQQIRVIGLRRRIAQKMQDAKRRIPHFSYVEECDVTELELLRAALNHRHGESRGRLTMLPFLLRAMVLAIAEFPQVNALFDDETGVITRHSAVHMGIATQTDAGLMVPVLSHAQDGDLWANAREITRLAQMTRAGKATRDELSGSTITVSSLGALGGIVSTPIINAPEVAIVGVNRIVERPMLVGGAFVARKMMNLSSSFDHRVVDGQDAARFIQAVRGFLETPATLFIA